MNVPNALVMASWSGTRTDSIVPTNSRWPALILILRIGSQSSLRRRNPFLRWRQPEDLSTKTSWTMSWQSSNPLPGQHPRKAEAERFQLSDSRTRTSHVRLVRDMGVTKAPISRVLSAGVERLSDHEWEEWRGRIQQRQYREHHRRYHR